MNPENKQNKHQAQPTAARPLEGVRVVDLGQYIAGPGAAMVLAELGAMVVKVEPLSGDQARSIGRYGESMIRAYNRGKRSIAIDLRTDAGREAAFRLIARSDVVIQNLRPGVVQKLGLGPDVVRARHPRAIYLSISGFGSRGPSRDRPGYDIAAQAESGLMSVTGEPDRSPQKVGVPIIDAAAAHLGAQAVLAALYGRHRSGVGETIDTSLLEVAVHLQATHWCEFLGGAPEPTRMGDGQPHNAPAAEVVPTRDGHIVLSAYADEHWARFCRVVGREELIGDARFDTNAPPRRESACVAPGLARVPVRLQQRRVRRIARAQPDRRRRGSHLRASPDESRHRGERHPGRGGRAGRNPIPRAGPALPPRQCLAGRPAGGPAMRSGHRRRSCRSGVW